VRREEWRMAPPRFRHASFTRRLDGEAAYEASQRAYLILHFVSSG